MFDQIAERYDLLNRLMSLGIDQRWRRKTVRALQLEPGQRVLDLATGTADLAVMIARLHPGVRIDGLDPSGKMLAVGQRKLEGARDHADLTPRITLREGDAQAMPYPDRSFDALCMAFGIRNVPDRSLALREMARVVRPGGRIAILELTEPEGGLLGTLARFHVHVVIPRLGGLLSGSREYRYLQESIARFPPAAVFAQQMRDAGLQVEEVCPLTFGSCHLFVARTPR